MAFVPDRAAEIAEEPYLSLVVTARNDDHGGNLLGRMQIFVDGWIEQARRHRIPSELIIVEWNPPADRPRLVEALRWPSDFGPCTVRIIEVPTEVHRRYLYADALPLYQMIGKNVGIRRSRGRFVLATNIDILFSTELAGFLAKQVLKPDCMYRIDRHDVMSDVPARAPLDEQLAYCQTHLLRINSREGTFPVSPDGTRVLSPDDVVPPGVGVFFGRGWFPVERYHDQEPFRWAQERAELLLPGAPHPTAVLLVDLEPGPGTGGAPLDLEILTGDNCSLAHLLVDRRSRLRLPLPTPLPDRLWFCAHNAGMISGRDPRKLSMRAFQCAWDPQGKSTLAGRPYSATLKPTPRKERLRLAWGALQLFIRKLATGGPLVPLTVPVSPRLRRLLLGYVEWGGFTGMIRRGVPYLMGRAFRRNARRGGRDTRAVGSGPRVISADGANSGSKEASASELALLHTNACGDFTLLAREHWFDLRGYPEFDLFSMNLDSVLCFAAHHGGAREEMLAEPMRIYHIEHGSGSGWTPEGQAKLFERLAVKGLPFIDNELVLTWAAQMRSLNAPMIFNHEDWGLAGSDLEEVTIPASRQGAL